MLLNIALNLLDLKESFSAHPELTCGPLDVFVNKSLSERAIHGSRLNFRMVSPVCPVHGTKETTHSYKT